MTTSEKNKTSSFPLIGVEGDKVVTVMLDRISNYGTDDISWMFSFFPTPSPNVTFMKALALLKRCSQIHRP